MRKNRPQRLRHLFLRHTAATSPDLPLSVAKQVIHDYSAPVVHDLAALEIPLSNFR